MGLYTSSKAALWNLTTVMAKEWGSQGVRVNAIAPGPFATDMMETATSIPELEELILSSLIIKRMADPSEVAELFSPNLYVYDAYPGGIGFSEPLYSVYGVLLQRTRELIAGCPCEQGCPSCVGPAGEKSERTKDVALAILDRLCSSTQALRA